MEKKYCFEKMYVALPSQINEEKDMIVQNPTDITIVEVTSEGNILDIETKEKIFYMKDENYEVNKKYVGVFKNDIVHFYNYLNMLKTDYISDIHSYVNFITKFKEEYNEEYFEKLREFLSNEILNFETKKTQKLSKMERKVRRRERKKNK